MFVYLELLDDYCQSCGMISLDDDTTNMVRSSYAYKLMYGFHRSGAIVAHGGTMTVFRKTCGQDENGYNFSGSCCLSNGAVPL